jgi:hypothetical protein
MVRIQKTARHLAAPRRLASNDLLHARAGVAVDLAAERDFGDLRGLPGHVMSSVLVAEKG